MVVEMMAGVCCVGGLLSYDNIRIQPFSATTTVAATRNHDRRVAWRYCRGAGLEVNRKMLYLWTVAQQDVVRWRDTKRKRLMQVIDYEVLCSCYTVTVIGT
jgi:hypothetical protein